MAACQVRPTNNSAQVAREIARPRWWLWWRSSSWRSDGWAVGSGTEHQWHFRTILLVVRDWCWWCWWWGGWTIHLDDRGAVRQGYWGHCLPLLQVYRGHSLPFILVYRGHSLPFLQVYRGHPLPFLLFSRYKGDTPSFSPGIQGTPPSFTSGMQGTLS